MDMEKLKKLAGLKTNGDYLKIIATDKKLHSDTPPSDDTQDELDSEITSFDDIDAEERNNADDVPKDSTDSSGIESLINSTYETLRALTWEFADNFFIDMEMEFGANITNDFINNKYSQENYTKSNQADLTKWIKENTLS